jgi:hypothetical protein
VSTKLLLKTHDQSQLSKTGKCLEQRCDEGSRTHGGNLKGASGEWYFSGRTTGKLDTFKLLILVNTRSSSALIII